MLDEQSGESFSSGTAAGGNRGRTFSGGPLHGDGAAVGYRDRGGASRFFYCAKASRAERGPGNTHPTVKPLDLMCWLVRLVTPPDGTVLDPFTGSGTTGLASLREGRSFIGIEREPEYVALARERIRADAPLFNTASEAA
jgi:hypothetical protein